ncbi:MAG: hypothetical protein BroJett014_23790 [Planctomycetota bacterium]|nr:MAG: hypothetical protein BroJett014_23790 [Planctomycetota bacterium]
MLDPGRYFAEAIYFLQYTLAQILWAINRATLSIAVIAESINSWVTDNVSYFVELLVNALSAPLGGMFILALTALGFWYALNNIVPTNRWVDPSKLFTYGLIAFFFFSSPIVVIDMMEDVRTALNAGIDTALIDGAAGDIFDTSMDGTDVGLPGAIPDVNSDGAVGSFDLVSAFMLVANMDELDSSEFPVDFEAAYYPFGDPSGIDLSDEADQELAKALASDGIERLFFALVAVPTAIAEHFLRLALTGVAMFLYAGVPFAMLFAFFIYTQAFLGAYLRQFINLLIETLMSVIIVAIMIGLLAAAAQQGIGLYIGASIITLIVLLWRIKSALKLAAAAFDLFGGSVITGGVGGMEVARMGRQAVTGTAMLAGAALTGGATVAAGGAVLATAAALQADGRNDGAYMGTDPNKTDGRVRQLKTIAGYALGRSETARSLIEGSHEARTLARNFRDGDVQPHDPDMLDYLRAGSSMSGFGSSPWLAMRFSPSLRAAYDEIGGRRTGNEARDAAFDGDGEPVDLPGALPANGVAAEGARNGRSARHDTNSAPADNDINDLWREEPATQRQLAYLQQLGVEPETGLTRGQASDLIGQARQTQRSQSETSVNGAANGQSPRGRTLAPNDALANRFASLEQALTNLTEALANPEGNGRIANGRADTPDDASVNGTVPDWLRETDEPSSPSAAAQDVGLVNDNDAGTDAVQNVNIVSAAPDLDRDGREDKYETMDVASAGTIRLEPYEASRGQVISDALAHLADPHSLAGQAAQRTLVTYTGANNARLIQGAVGQHTATAVQEAAEATANLVTQYRTQGMDDAAVLAAFQSGEAAAAIREATAAQDSPTPLTDAQLSAVADMVLLPQRRLTRTELVGVIGREAATGAADEQSVIQALGMPIGFGGQTGNVRGVMAGAQAMNLSPADLARLVEMIQDGLRDVVQAELADRGYRTEIVRHFVSDMAALPGAMVVPQSAAVKTIAAAVASATDGAGATAVSAPQPQEE